MARPDYCRFLPDKWRQRTLHLPLEVEGLLIRISSFNMDAGIPLPKDRTVAARMLGVHRNKLDKLLAVLIEAGEIEDDAKGIYSKRALEEFRRASRRVGPQANPRPTPEQPPSNPEATPHHTPQVEAEKSEEILRAKEKREEEKREDNNKPASSESEAACGLASLNGSIDLIIADVRGWMPTGDERSARQWVQNNIQIFGADVLRDAYTKLGADIASGQRFAQPIKTLTAIAQRMAKCKPTASAAAPVESQAERFLRLGRELEAQHGSA